MDITEADIKAWVIEWCNNSFLNDAGTEVLPPGVKIFISKAQEYLQNKSGVRERTMGSVSYTYEMDFPPALLRLLRPYKKVKFR